MTLHLWRIFRSTSFRIIELVERETDEANDKTFASRRRARFIGDNDTTWNALESASLYNVAAINCAATHRESDALYRAVN